MLLADWGKAKAKAKAKAKPKKFAEKFAEKLAATKSGKVEKTGAPAEKVAAVSKPEKTGAPAAKVAADTADTAGKLCGKKVKVVSLFAGAAAYQKVGKVVVHNADSDKLCLQLEDHSHSGFITTEGKFCQEFSKCSPPMKTRKKLTFSQPEKLKLLVRFPGWVLEHPEEKVHLDGKDLSSRQMQMIWELIKRDVECKAVVFLAVEDVQALCGLCVDGKADQLTVELQKLVLQWQQPGVRKLLLPVWSCKGAAHYTLLVFEAPGEAGKEAAVRYYDSLTSEHAGCREVAELMRFVVKVALTNQEKESLRWELPKQVPARRMPRFQEQGSNRCGINVLYYAEMEARETTGEIGVLPFPCGSELLQMYIKRLDLLTKTLIKFKDLPGKCKAEAKKLEDDQEKALQKLQEVAEAAVSSKALLGKLKNLQESYIEELGAVKPCKFGCDKCKWQGSTCCDPDKKDCKRKAQAEFAGLSWPLSAEDAKKLKEDAGYDQKLYNSFVKIKKAQVKDDNKKMAVEAFKKKMGDWSKNMQLGKLLLDEQQAAKKLAAEKATAAAKEATAEEPTKIKEATSKKVH